MYEELVKRIRGCSYSDPNGCEECRDCPNAENYYECKQKLALQAADAIETLIGKVKYLIERCDMADKNCSEAVHLGAMWKEAALDQKSWWIPVEERLPEKYHQVLVYGLNGMQIDYYAGEKSIGGHPLFMISEAKVTHWQPLPEPPKEET